jgi:hypothetical protein
MSVQAGTVTVGSDKAYLIVPAPSGESTGGPNRPGLVTTVTNVGSQAVFLGSSTVTGSTNGYQLAAGASVTLNLANIDALYGIALGGSQSVSWLQGWQ